MTGRTNLVGQGTDEVAAAGGQGQRARAEPGGPVVPPATPSEQQAPTRGGTAGRRDPARGALLLIAVVILVGAVTYLGPILKPFLVAVFLYFSTKAAAGFLIRLRFPPS